MVAHRLDVGDDQLVLLRLGDQLGQRRDIAAGEDVFAGPFVGDARPAHPAAAMREHHPVVLQQAVGVREEARIMRRAEMLDQADAGDPVELAL